MSKIIIANWKMHSSKSFINSFFNDLPHNHNPLNKIIFCPPFPYLSILQPILDKRNYFLGGQDCHNQEHGAFTGDVSAAMLKDMGCKYVIIGHSERRHYHKESNQIILEKSQMALQNGLIPIICVGESLQDRQSGQHFMVIKQQIVESIPCTNSIIIAYEPIWAIGTGLTSNLEDIREMHQMITNNFKCQILYGGSVTDQNSKEILAQPNVGGILVGGASLKPAVFGNIIR